METSAKTGFNVNKLFCTIGKILYEQTMKDNQINKKPSERVKLEPKAKEEAKGGCCHK